MDSTESLERIEPRPEARPLAWTAMTMEQQEATRRLGVLLRNLADQKFLPLVPQQGVERFLPPIDEQRKNHVFLLDGGRGSGKTALLVTHLSVWAWGVRREESRQTTENAPDKNLQDALQPLGQIVPVGLLDLQPLPESANLLAYVVTRFKRIVEAIESCTGHEGTRAAWHAAGPEALQSATEWQNFLNAAAAGWDGALTNRRAHADPATFAVEFEQAEEQRLDVVSSFRRFIDALVADYPRIGRLPKNKPPLFVLGIDDADMNVAKSAELLDIVRTLWHPRLAFLLTGDSRLFRAALEVRAHKDLTGSSHEDRTTINSLSRTLPRDIYEKIVPQLHRLELRSMSSQERLSLLEKWFDARMNAEDLKRISKVRSLFDQYPLQTALPSRLRPLQDFELWVIGIYNHGKPIDDGVVEARVLHYLWKHALDEAGSPAHLESWVTEDDERRVVVQLDQANKFLLSTRSRPFIAAKGARVEVGHGWRLDVYAANGAMVPDNLAACLLPLLDLGADDQNRHVVSLIAPSLDRSTFAVVVVRLTDQLPWVSWPLPQWTRFADWLVFAKRWFPRVEKLARDKELSTTALAFAYLDSVLGIDAGINEQPWRERAVLLKAIVDDSSVAIPLRRWATRDAFLLAAPESGLSVDDANAWIKAVSDLFAENEWNSIRARLMKLRHKRLQAAVGGAQPNFDEFDVFDRDDQKQLEHYLKEIQNKASGYLWFAMVERDATATLGALLERMSQIFVPGERSAGTLLNYVPPARLKELSAAPVDLLERLHNTLETLSKQQGSAGIPAIEMLWRIVTTDEVAALQDTVSYKGRLAFNSAKAFEFAGRPSVVGASNGNLILDSRRSDKVGLRLSRGHITWLPETPLIPPILAILRMVWDVESDSNLRDESPLVPWWRLAQGARDKTNRQRFPWPAAPWPTFLDWERLIHAWNEKVLPKVEALAEEGKKTGVGIDVYGDSAAYWYVSTIAHMSQHRCDLEHIEFGIESDPTRWQNDVRRWFTERQHNSNNLSAHRRAFHDWLDRIGLLAAPESGLSPSVAENILAGIPDLAQRRTSLAKLRRERLTQMQLSESERKDTLDGIDRVFDDHPWTKLIEEPLRLPPATSEGSSGS